MTSTTGTAAPRCCDGHDPVTVAARLGHSPDALLRIYAQEIEEGEVGVAASLAAPLA